MFVPRSLALFGLFWWGPLKATCTPLSEATSRDIVSDFTSGASNLTTSVEALFGDIFSADWWSDALPEAIATYAWQAVDNLAPDLLATIEEVRTSGERLMADLSIVAAQSDDISGKLERVLMRVLEDIQGNFPSPDRAPSHSERKGSISMMLMHMEDAIVQLGADTGIPETDMRLHTGEILSSIEDLVVTVGDLIEQHPIIFEVVLISSWLLLFETRILRPILNCLGFGPLGPGKGSPAAWAQRAFFGSSVPKQSWFSYLQKAGMRLV